MTNEKELIRQLKQLKTIKPNQDWVVSVKKSIFEVPASQPVLGRWAGLSATAEQAFRSFAANRKMAYSFAVLLLTVISLQALQVSTPEGTSGTLAVLTSQSPAALSAAAELDIKAEMELIKEKSKVLAREYPKSAEVKPQDSGAQQKAAKVKELKTMVSNMTEAAQKDPRLAKVIASQIENSVTYLNVIDSEDLQETSGNFVKTIVEGMFDYYKTVTLTEENKKELAVIEDSYALGNLTASQALEAMLLFNAGSQDKPEESPVSTVEPSPELSTSPQILSPSPEAN